jgi:hypothetical protein
VRAGRRPAQRFRQGPRRGCGAVMRGRPAGSREESQTGAPRISRQANFALWFARHGMGEAGRGVARQARRGLAGRGWAWLGAAARGPAGKARRGEARLGTAGPGLGTARPARPARHGQSGQSRAGLGAARRGAARRGAARRGKAGTNQKQAGPIAARLFCQTDSLNFPRLFAVRN